MSTAATSKEKRIFSLQEARELIPLVRKITASTVGQVNTLMARLEFLSEDDPDFEEARSAIDGAVRMWAERLQNLGCDIQGLWLVDFDNGQGFYCWSYPEDELDHFHTYEDGFAGRTRIC